MPLLIAMKKAKKVFVYLFALGVISLIIALPGISYDVEITNYDFKSDKISGKIRVVFISDLHSCHYGENQTELTNSIKELNPDVVLLGGDIFDDDIPPRDAEIFIRYCASQCPTYYVAGNHDFWSNNIEELKQKTRDAGAVVLQGDCSTLAIGHDTINICGVDDPTEIKNDSLMQQLQYADAKADKKHYTILLSHRPEIVDMYKEFSFDLILAGHAHGGQWAIPFLLKNGLLAPDQGLFPKYTNGLYEIGHSKMIVSRGLAKESTRVPRIYNTPEIVYIELKGK